MVGILEGHILLPSFPSFPLGSQERQRQGRRVCPSEANDTVRPVQLSSCRVRFFCCFFFQFFFLTLLPVLSSLRLCKINDTGGDHLFAQSVSRWYSTRTEWGLQLGTVELTLRSFPPPTPHPAFQKNSPNNENRQRLARQPS